MTLAARTIASAIPKGKALVSRMIGRSLKPVKTMKIQYANMGVAPTIAPASTDLTNGHIGILWSTKFAERQRC